MADPDTNSCHCCKHLLAGWIMDEDGETIDDMHNQNIDDDMTA